MTRPLYPTPSELPLLLDGRQNAIEVVMQLEFDNKTVSLVKIPVCEPDIYLAGDDGQIYTRAKFHANRAYYGSEWRALKGSIKHGYRAVSVRYNGEFKSKFVHRLINMSFNGMPNDKSLQTRHLDGNKLNNLPSNLSWGTAWENYLDRLAHGTVLKHEAHPSSKISNHDRVLIKWAYEKKIATAKHMSKIFGLAIPTILDIAHEPYAELEITVKRIEKP